jgi:hypothetical protein
MESNNVMRSARCPNCAVTGLFCVEPPASRQETHRLKEVTIMTLPKSIELKWHCEVIERWLNTPGIPSDAREGLLVMQREVKEEMETLEQSLNCSC